MSLREHIIPSVAKRSAASEGGRALNALRNKALTAHQRREIAMRAARARWAGHSTGQDEAKTAASEETVAAKPARKIKRTKNIPS